MATLKLVLHKEQIVPTDPKTNTIQSKMVLELS